MVKKKVAGIVGFVDARLRSPSVGMDCCKKTSMRFENVLSRGVRRNAEQDARALMPCLRPVPGREELPGPASGEHPAGDGREHQQPEQLHHCSASAA